jgi:hypothetical protein
MFNVENGDILSGIYHRIYHDVAFTIEFTIEYYLCGIYHRIYHRILWKKIGANHQHSWLNQPYSDGMKRMGLGGA